MGRYTIPMNRTASTTLAVGSVTADATRPRRIKIYDVIIGSEASPPADGAFVFSLDRCTAAGTSTSVTPQPLDPADAATEMDAGKNHTVDPTGSTPLLVIAMNQRVTFRWTPHPGGELVTPATASNGLAVRTPTAALVAVTATVHVEEQ